MFNSNLYNVNVPDTYSADDIMNGYLIGTYATIAVTEITVQGDEDASSVAQGETLQMSAVVLPTDASNSAVTWSIESGSEYASIDQDGLLTATAVGTVMIRATAQDGSGIYGELQITITSASASITVSSLGLMGDLTVETNVYNIQDNSSLGVMTFGVAKDRLPGDLSSAVSYTLQLDDTAYELSQNMFNSNLYNVNVPDTYSVDDINDGLFIGVF
jgi:uncharacterized protein YjdB